MTGDRAEIQGRWDGGVEVTRIIGNRHFCRFDGGDETAVSFCNNCGGAFIKDECCASCGGSVQ